VAYTFLSVHNIILSSAVFLLAVLKAEKCTLSSFVLDIQQCNECCSGAQFGEK